MKNTVTVRFDKAEEIERVARLLLELDDLGYSAGSTSFPVKVVKFPDREVYHSVSRLCPNAKDGHVQQVTPKQMLDSKVLIHSCPVDFCTSRIGLSVNGEKSIMLQHATPFLSYLIKTFKTKNPSGASFSELKAIQARLDELEDTFNEYYWDDPQTRQGIKGLLPVAAKAKRRRTDLGKAITREMAKPENRQALKEDFAKEAAKEIVRVDSLSEETPEFLKDMLFKKQEEFSKELSSSEQYVISDYCRWNGTAGPGSGVIWQPSAPQDYEIRTLFSLCAKSFTLGERFTAVPLAVHQLFFLKLVLRGRARRGRPHSDPIIVTHPEKPSDELMEIFNTCMKDSNRGLNPADLWVMAQQI